MRNLKVGDFIYTWSEQYGNTIYEVVSIDNKCLVCNQQDKIALQIVCNNNFGFDGYYNKVFPYNQKKGLMVYDCEKNIAKFVAQNKMKLFTEKQAIVMRQKLLNNQWN